MTITPQLLRVCLAAYMGVSPEALAKLTVREFDQNAKAIRRVLEVAAKEMAA